MVVVHRRGFHPVTSRGERPDERGAIIIVFTLVITALLVIGALTIDIGNASQQRRQAQNAADAAALAGAQDLSSGGTSATAVQAIKNYTAKNFGSVSWAGCTDPSLPTGWVQPDAGESCISFDLAVPLTTKVRVVVPVRHVGSIFGGVSGRASLDVSAHAVANVASAGSVIASPCGFCSLNSAALQNGTVSVTGGAAYVGGTLACNPQGTITSTVAVDVVGTNSCGNVTATTVASIGDPLASLPASPNTNGLTAMADCSGGVASPGIYNNIGTCTLQPGLYVVTGTLGGTGHTAVLGPSVTIFFTCGTAAAPRACTPGETDGGSLSFGGQASAGLTSCPPPGPCVGGATPGMVLWFDRNDNVTNTLHGGGTLDLVGTVYGASASFDIKGTPAGTAGTCLLGFCSEMMVSTVNFSGQGTLSVSYAAGQNVVIRGPSSLVQLAS